MQIIAKNCQKMFKTEFILANFAFFVKVISRKNAAATVARGPVPRDGSNKTRNVRSPKGHGRFFETIDAWRGTGPRPTVGGEFWHGAGQVFPTHYGEGGAVWITTK